MYLFYAEIQPSYVKRGIVYIKCMYTVYISLFIEIKLLRVESKLTEIFKFYFCRLIRSDC